jgi:TolA-binding protein
MNEIVVALIAAGSSVLVGVFSLVGVAITNNKSNNKMQNDMKTAQAVTEERIDELTREVREHNNFAKRMPVVEEQIKVINHRIEDLEGYHKPHTT